MPDEDMVAMQPTSHQMFQAYPKDPSEGITEIIRYLDGTGDYKNLIAGIYDEVGFVLNLTIGAPNTNLDPVIMGAALTDLHKAMTANPDKTAAIPDWLKPLLTAAIQALYTWLLNRKKPAPG